MIAAVLAGSADAFADLVRRYQDPLVGYLYGALGDLEQAHEVAREVLRQVYRELDRYDTRYRFSSWLFWLARKKARRRGRQCRGSPVQEAVHRLSPDHRQLILLRHYAGLPLEEIANLQGLPPAAVRQEISLARRRLGQESRE